MKGAIVQCLGDLVKNNFGEDKWENSLEKAGMNKKAFFTPIQNVDDQNVLKLLDTVCEVLKVSQTQAAEAFGEYWVSTYAPKVYSSYYMGVKSAKEFIKRMDNVHDNVTKNIPNAHPPGFDYDWKDDRTLIMKYRSNRGLIDILVGLVKAVGKHYNEDLKVTKMGTDRVQIIFPA